MMLMALTTRLGRRSMKLVEQGHCLRCSWIGSEQPHYPRCKALQPYFVSVPLSAETWQLIKSVFCTLSMGTNGHNRIGKQFLLQLSATLRGSPENLKILAAELYDVALAFLVLMYII